MATRGKARLTVDEYRAIERAAEYKSEFYDGEMFAMAGGSLVHSLLAARIALLLGDRLPPGCYVFQSELRVQVERAGFFTYPDVTVVCGPFQTAEDHNDELLNPMVIVEVLSPSTKSFDRGRKFEMYRTIPSFREYLLIHQDRPLIEHYSRQESGGWLLRDLTVESTIVLDPLQARIPVQDLYSVLPPSEESAFNGGA